MSHEPKHEHSHEHPAEKKKPRLQEHHKKAIGFFLFISSIVVVMVLLLLTSTAAVKMTFGERIYKNVTVAGIHVGGLEKTEASKKLQQNFERMIAGGLTLELAHEVKSADLSPLGATDPDLVYPILDTDIDALTEAAYQTGREGDTLAAFFGPLWYSTFGGRVISAKVNVASTKLSDTIKQTFPEAESTGAPTDFLIEGKQNAYKVTVTAPITGTSIDFKAAAESLAADAADFKLEPLHLALREVSVIISPEEAETLIPAVETALNQAPYQATFTNEYLRRMAFTVSVEDLKTWLLPEKDETGHPVLTVDPAAMSEFFKKIHESIDVSAQDAVFETEGTRVTKFEPSREGLRVDDDAFVASLTSAFVSGVKEISLSAMTTEPDITTAESNKMGIEEVLGAGISKYGGSPSNRRANIRHGANKLNGLLIAPGETLSLIEKLGPFTVKDGYLPELVIKGDEIIPEIGGGLCQIGTTSFRAAMNSGLEIAERRNHSLVVSYYNDLANNKPGTDATIYDPAPDLKIKNDTAAYILFMTENDTATSTLTFSFWGTSDGRQGSYTPPVVLNWVGAGAKITKETDSLAPGVTKCQASHPGANTIFTYNISRADGTITTRDFPSTYRALPTICLVGKDPNVPAPADAAAADGANTPIVTGVTDAEVIPVE